MCHTSVIIYSSPKIRIIYFGGLDTLPEDVDLDKEVPIAQTTVVELCKCALHTGNVISNCHIAGKFGTERISFDNPLLNHQNLIPLKRLLYAGAYGLLSINCRI